MSAPHEHHLAHLWWAGVHPMLLSGSGKAYQTLRTLLAGYYAFELQLAMGGDCVGACIEKLELGEYGEREVKAMEVLLARRIERQDNVVAQAEEDQPEEEAAEGAEGEDDVGPAQAALAGQAVAVPATPGLPLAVATSSSGVSVPALPTASNTSMPAARALAGAMDAVAEAKREVKREDKQEVKVEAKMAAVPAPRMDTNIRVRELFPLLERRGWMQVAGRGRGSHRVFTNPAHPEWGHLSIPFHGNRTTFSAGLLRQVLLKARILQR